MELIIDVKLNIAGKQYSPVAKNESSKELFFYYVVENCVGVKFSIRVTVCLDTFKAWYVIHKGSAFPKNENILFGRKSLAGNVGTIKGIDKRIEETLNQLELQIKC